ncbi:MAG TPA: carbohydrate kinase family protein [Anaerolineaceae bacterium]|nr:carbohydrate kinase family protein [Anaerolineaceae bacterium]
MSCDVACVGMALTDVLVKGVNLQNKYTYEARMAESVNLWVGGDAANESIVLAHLGVKTKLIAGVGADATGTFIRTVISSQGVNTDDFATVSDYSSLVSIVMIDASGERNFIFAGAITGDHFKPNLEALRGAKIVSLGSMGVPPISNNESILRIVKTAKENGSIVCADAVYMPGGFTYADLKESLQYIDYVFPNLDEAKALTGKQEIDEVAKTILDYGVKHAIVKQGKDGCWAFAGDEKLFVPAYKVNTVDTTGAGDNFMAGFMCAILDGKDLEGCCKFATAAAAVSIQTIGANTGVKNKQQVLDFMKAMEAS